MPPSKFRIFFLAGFSFLFGFCCCWPARKAGASNNSMTTTAKLNLGRKRPISIFQKFSVHPPRRSSAERRSRRRRTTFFRHRFFAAALFRSARIQRQSPAGEAPKVRRRECCVRREQV